MSSEKFWPTPGQKLIHKLKKGAGQIEGEVLEVDQYTGRVSLRVQGHVYPSLSAAATAISGSSTNGWVYWGLKKPKQKSTQRISETPATRFGEYQLLRVWPQKAERANIPLTLTSLDHLVQALLEYYEKLDLDTQQLVPLKKIYWPIQLLRGYGRIEPLRKGDAR